VLVADDHAPTREELRHALERDRRFEVCAEASDTPGAIQAAVHQRPDVCLLDVNMPGWGPAAAWEISSRLPHSKVVMLTVSRESADLLAALRAGAAGYLLKDVQPPELVGAIRTVHAGEALLAPAVATMLVEQLAAEDGAGAERDDHLTPREREVLALLARGRANKVIARDLGVSERTVKTHVSNILAKLNLTDRTQAAVYAVRHGIVPKD
jgi:DNA-binding NarL/FixJ family response regulator